MPNVFTLSIATGIGLQGVVSDYVTPIHLSVATGLKLVGVPTLGINRNIVLSVGANLELTGDPTLLVHHLIPLTVTANLGLQGVPTLGRTSTYALSVSAGLGLQGVPTDTKTTTIFISIAAGLGLQGVLPGLSSQGTHKLSVSAGLGLQGVPTINFTKQVSVSAGLGLSASPSTNATRSMSVSASLGLSATAAQFRVLILSVSAGLGMSGASAPQNNIGVLTPIGHLGLQGVPTLFVDTLHVSGNVGFQAVVSAVIIVNQGLPTGPSTKLLSGISGTFPLTFAETPSGVVLMANGVDPMLRWDGLSNTADYAGVTPPSAPVTLTASGLGTITGTRYAFCRFIDSAGNPSNLSPIGAGVQCGRDGSIDDITSSNSLGYTIESRGHGLSTGDVILIQGVNGLPINGSQLIAVPNQDPDHFVLLTAVPFNTAPTTQAQWLGGGSWSLGSASLTYTGYPTSATQSRVSRVQLLRNLEGNCDVIYVDSDVLISPGTIIPTTYVSSLTDDQLAQNEAVVIRTEDHWPYSLRYTPPPSNRPYIVNYLGRIFAAGDAVVFAGSVSVQQGSNVIQGVGTQWTSSLAGRQIYIKGSTTPYGILSVTSNQNITISGPYESGSNPFATYLIRSSPGDRKVLQWSEADNPEAWPPWNAVSLPEDNDEVTGLFVKGTYLYLTERRHIWRFQFTDDPATSGHAFLVVDQRGALSQRVVVQADDHTFLMDETGIYSFDGASGVEAISDPIQNVFYQDGLTFTQQIDWSADQTLWHASLDPIRTIVRWFVTMTGQPPLSWAICYNYRLKRWWLEQYPVALSSSCTGTLAEAPNVGLPSGYRRPLVGADARQVLVLGEGSLDLVPDAGTLQGTVASSTTTTLTDTSAAFAPNLAGSPLTIVSGTGAGQTTLISSLTGQTLTVVDAFTQPLDSTSVYQIGGVSWAWRSGWLDVEDSEQQSNRDLIVGFEPLANPASFSVQLYYDHQTSPETFALDQSLDGVTVNAGDSNIWFDMSSTDVLPGYRVFRQAQHTERYAYSDRYVSLYLSGVTNAEVVRVYQVSLRGVDQEGL